MRLLAILCCAAALAGPVIAQSKNPKKRTALDRFQRLTPEERKRAIGKLPPDRQRALENRLDNYDKLSDDERRRLGRSLESFDSLPPERQEAVRRGFRQLNALKPDRRMLVREELRDLRGLTDEERRQRLASEPLQVRFSAEEREILDVLSGAALQRRAGPPGPA